MRNGDWLYNLDIGEVQTENPPVPQVRPGKPGGGPADEGAPQIDTPSGPLAFFAPRGISRIEQCGAEQAQREIDRGAKKLENERTKAEAQRAAARAPITTLREQLGTARRRAKALSKVVGILETM